jgi:hypothetical protein
VAFRSLAAEGGRLGRGNHDGTVAATVGSQTEYIEPPAHKDIDTQTVLDLRRILNSAGYGTRAGDVAAKSQKD